MSHQMNVKLDDELYGLIVAHVRSSGMNASQIVRDALRTYFNAAHSPRERGWREGFMAGVARVRRDVAHAIASLDPTVPPEGSPGEDGPFVNPSPSPAPRRPRARR